jgi:mannosyltransferase OCH1-like enzyme
VHVYWSDASCLALVADRFPSSLAIYTDYQHNIQRVDACRYFLLYQFGGVYFDTDVSFHLEVEAPDTVPAAFLRLLPQGVGLIESPYKYNEKLQNSLMTSLPKHSFWSKFVFPLLVKRGRSEKRT